MTRDCPEEIGQMSNGKWQNPSHSINDIGHDYRRKYDKILDISWHEKGKNFQKFVRERKLLGWQCNSRADGDLRVSQRAQVICKIGKLGSCWAPSWQCNRARCLAQGVQCYLCFSCTTTPQFPNFADNIELVSQRTQCYLENWKTGHRVDNAIGQAAGIEPVPESSMLSGKLQ